VRNSSTIMSRGVIFTFSSLKNYLCVSPACGLSCRLLWENRY